MLFLFIPAPVPPGSWEAYAQIHYPWDATTLRAGPLMLLLELCAASGSLPLPHTPLRCINRQQSHLKGDDYLYPALPACWLSCYQEIQATFFPVYVHHTVQLIITFLAPQITFAAAVMIAQLQMKRINKATQLESNIEPVPYLKCNRVYQLQWWCQKVDLSETIAPQDRLESNTSIFLLWYKTNFSNI